MSLFDGPVKIYFQYYGSTFTRSCEGGGKSLNGFKFGDFMIRFPSDGAASMAVKGLMIDGKPLPCNLPSVRLYR